SDLLQHGLFERELFLWGDRQGAIPQMLRPQLEMPSHPGPKRFLVELRLLTQMRGNEHAPRLVELALHRSRNVEPPKAHDVRIHARQLGDLFFELLPRSERVQVQAGVEGRRRDHETLVPSGTRNRFAEPYGQADPPLGVDRVLELP